MGHFGMALGWQPPVAPGRRVRIVSGSGLKTARIIDRLDFSREPQLFE